MMNSKTEFAWSLTVAESFGQWRARARQQGGGPVAGVAVMERT
jgi:hypothetical protein